MPIKAQELRIGNYIHVLGIQFQIHEFSHTELRFMSDGRITIEPCPIHEAKPIPLTAEWLEKFGFESHDKGHIIRIDINSGLILERSIYEDIGKAFDVMILQEPKDCIIFSWSIKYVHTLQNLFHSITGQELTIKS